MGWLSSVIYFCKLKCEPLKRNAEVHNRATKTIPVFMNNSFFATLILFLLITNRHLWFLVEQIPCDP
jgi:hypothetical protein